LVKINYIFQISFKILKKEESSVIDVKSGIFYAVSKLLSQNLQPLEDSRASPNTIYSLSQLSSPRR